MHCNDGNPGVSAAPGDGTSAARRGSESHSTPRLLNRSSSSSSLLIVALFSMSRLQSRRPPGHGCAAGAALPRRKGDGLPPNARCRTVAHRRGAPWLQVLAPHPATPLLGPAARLDAPDVVGVLADGAVAGELAHASRGEDAGEGEGESGAWRGSERWRVPADRDSNAFGCLLAMLGS